MTREEHLRFCKVCKNKKFDRDKGIVCSLTNEIADFENECPNFLADAEEIQKEIKKTSEPLKNNAKRASIVINVFWAMCVTNVLAIVSGFLELELLERFSNGGFVSDQEASMNDLRQGAIGLFQLILLIASIVTFLNWFRRAYGNLHRLNTKPSYREEMAVWSFFIPFVNLYRPFQIAKEILSLSVQKLAAIDQNSRISSSTFILGLWWALYLISNFVGNIVFRMTMNGGETLQDIISQSQAFLFSDVVEIPAIIATILAIKKISNIESQLLEKTS
ncbi:DUF4328 domain-containing protein [Ekhidna sp.]